MSTSYGGGYCDCGDPEAWSSGVHCSIHAKGLSAQSADADPLSKLPEEIQKRSRHVFTAVLNYAYEILTYETFLTLPADLTYKKIMYMEGGGSGPDGAKEEFSYSCDSSDLDFSFSSGASNTGDLDGGDVYAAGLISKNVKSIVPHFQTKKSGKLRKYLHFGL